MRRRGVCRAAVLVVLGVVVSAPLWAYQERIAASLTRLALSVEQEPEFRRILEAHYGSLKSLYARQSRQVSGLELEKQLRRGVRRINVKTTERMAEVLDAVQMEELRYLLDLITRQFEAEVGVRD